MSEMSRRNFLVGAGVTTGALAALSLGARSANAAYTAFPWPYVQLNVEAVRKAGYDAYKIGGCMYGTASALFNALAASAGAPWDSVPVDLFKYGSGGAAGWGTTCGSLNGACYAIQACAGANVGAVINALFDWYCKNAFPSTALDPYSAYPGQKTTIANSPLCHASASNWSYSTRFKINSAERKERCAKVAGDVAAKTAELLNNLAIGIMPPGFTQPDATCSNCHVGATSTYDHVQMKSTCTAFCHKDKTSGHYSTGGGGKPPK